MKPMFKNAGKFAFGAGWALMAGGTVAGSIGRDEIVWSFILGLGVGLVAVGVVSMFVAWKNPKYKKQQEINMKDERNIQIRGKAGYGTFVITMFTLLALAIAMLALEQFVACALTICALVIHTLSFFTALFYYGRR
jgi:uncharacterized membrane protein